MLDDMVFIFWSKHSFLFANNAHGLKKREVEIIQSVFVNLANGPPLGEFSMLRFSFISAVFLVIAIAAKHCSTFWAIELNYVAIAILAAMWCPCVL